MALKKKGCVNTVPRHKRGDPMAFKMTSQGQSLQPKCLQQCLSSQLMSVHGRPVPRRFKTRDDGLHVAYIAQIEAVQADLSDSFMTITSRRQ